MYIHMPFGFIPLLPRENNQAKGNMLELVVGFESPLSQYPLMVASNESPTLSESVN